MGTRSTAEATSRPGLVQGRGVSLRAAPGRERGAASRVFTYAIQTQPGAAYAIEQDAELCSNDTDFGCFPGLRWTDPLKP